MRTARVLPQGIIGCSLASAGTLATRPHARERRARVLKQLATLGCLLATCVACAHDLRPREPPRDARKRWEAEMDACYRRTLPAWLDDASLAEAARRDRIEAQASRANDGFRGATYTPQPPPSAGGARVPALLEERTAFQEKCALLRASGKGPRTRP